MSANYILEHLAVGNPVDAQCAHEHFDAFLNVASEVGYDPSFFGDKPYLKVAIDDMKPIPAFRLMEAAAIIEPVKREENPRQCEMVGFFGVRRAGDDGPLNEDVFEFRIQLL